MVLQIDSIVVAASLDAAELGGGLKYGRAMVKGVAEPYPIEPPDIKEITQIDIRREVKIVKEFA